MPTRKERREIRAAMGGIRELNLRHETPEGLRAKLSEIEEMLKITEAVRKAISIWTF